jgi:tRNA pseudouridine55 synthase
MAHCGILNVNKPAGCTSRDVVNRIDRLCRPAKSGHAGTLDPLATGVLVICVGQATRLIQYVQQMRKIYRATFLLGRSSTSDDTETAITVLDDVPVPNQAAIDQAVPQFIGTIQQRPPAHSAVKVKGLRAYQLARRGAEVELAPRFVTIHNLRLMSYEYPQLQLEIECGSGTYVRAVGRDLAAALGTTAIMSELQRTAIGGFRMEDAARLDDLTTETWSAHLQPAIAAVPDLPRLLLNDSQLADIRHGRPIAASALQTDTPFDRSPAWAAVDASGQLVAILCRQQPNHFWPTKNLA